MGSLARGLVFTSCAITSALTAAELGGCGFDGQGVADVSDSAPPEADAPRDAEIDGFADAEVDADAGPDADADADADAARPDPCSETGLILCLPFDGTAADGAHAQQVVVAGTVSYVTGVHGKAMLLDATSQVTVPDNTNWSYASLTLETWVRPDALPGMGGRAGIFDKDGSWGVFVFSDGSVNCAMNQNATGPAITSLGTWVHIACVNDGTTSKLYVNGVMTTSVAAAALTPKPTLGAVANNSPTFGSPLIGALDELRVFSQAKTAAEITADAKP